MTSIHLSDAGFSVSACGRTFVSAPWDCRVTGPEGKTASFADASCRVEPFVCGVGRGYAWTYRDFPGFPGLELECRLWAEDATGDVIAELIPLQDAPVEEILWPAPFENPREDAYTVLPLMQGVLVPNHTQETYPDVWPILPWYLEYRHSCSRCMYMQFFGQYDGEGGCMTILETRYDGGMTVDSGAGKPVLAGVRWRESLGKVGYARRLRMKFFGPGADYNTLAKAYRAYVKSIGELVTLRQKAAENPKVAALIGRPLVHTYIWYHTVPEARDYDPEHPEKNDRMQSFGEVARQLQTLKEKGLEKAVVHLDGWGRRGYDNQHPDYLPPAEALGGWQGMWELADTCHELGYFFGTHDQYRDYFYDADTFDERWAVHNADGGVTSHAIWIGGKQTFLCATQAPYYVRRNFDALAAENVALDNAYLDVFSCVELDECFHPEHPMTREECARARMRCFREVAARGILVQSEEGIDWAFPGLIFVHHAPFAPVAGIRVPLLELVYHDCLITPWHEGEDRLFGYLTGGACYVAADADAETVADGRRRAAWQEKVQLREMLRHELVEGDPNRQRAWFAGGYWAEIDLTMGTWETHDPEGEQT